MSTTPLVGVSSARVAAQSTSEPHPNPRPVLGGDIFNLGDLYGASPGQLARTGALQRWQRRGGAKPRSHCSALIRVLPGNADLCAAHTTWSGLENMNRILVGEKEGGMSA